MLQGLPPNFFNILLGYSLETMPERKERSFRVYKPHETARMLELEGLELASFKSRACAYGVDFLVAGGLFLGAFVILLKTGTLQEPVGDRSITKCLTVRSESVS